MMKKRFLALGLAVLTVLSYVPLTGYAATATTNTTTSATKSAEMTISYLDIMTLINMDSTVTRAQFAQMLVNSSSYKGKTQWTTQTSPFVDVPSSYWASPSIQVAVNSGWMYGYLGGKFKPDEAISLQEAVYGVTGLLGYTKADFSGSQLSARMSLYYELDLDDNISKTATQTITKRDAMNLLYNMLKTNPKSGAATYAESVFECTYDSTSGEINYLAIVDDNRIGPILLEDGLSSYLPFALSEGTYYIDDVSGRSAQIGAGDVIYYSPSLKTVWAYTDCTATYEIMSSTKVYYANGGVTPTSVVFDDKIEYTFDNSSIAYEFSALGGAMVADKTITIIFEDRSTDLAESYVITGVLY